MGQSRIPQLRAGRNSWEVEAILKMFFQTTFVFLALALSAHGERPSRDAINARLKNFDGFFSERVTVIHKAGVETKDAINSVSDELRQLLKMLADELKFTDDDIAKVTEETKQCQERSTAKEVAIDELERSEKNLKNLVENLNETQISLQREKKDLKEANAKQVETIKSKDDTIKKIQDEKSVIKRILEQMEGDFENVVQEKDNCEDERTNLETTVDDLMTSNDELSAHINALQEKINQLTTERNVLKEELNITQEIVDVQEKEKETLNVQIQDLET